MSKINSIIDFSIILNRGFEPNDACDYFEEVNHPKLVDEFIEYVTKNKKSIGLLKVENRQSITDFGCDVYVELKNNVKIGVQIKSYNDVKQTDFASKVKAQYAESLILNLDKFYILICCPHTNTTEKKVNYLLGHFAAYKTNYHAVFGPNNCVKLFIDNNLMPESEFLNHKQLYSQEEDSESLKNLLTEIKNKLPNIRSSLPTEALQIAEVRRTSFTPIESAKKFIKYLELPSDVDPQDIIEQLNDIIKRIGRLPDNFKELYYTIISESERSTTYIDSLEIDMHELEALSGISAVELVQKINILDSPKYKLVSYDEDEPQTLSVYLCLKGDYNFPLDLKNFIEENRLNLEDFLLRGNFNLLN